MLGTLGRRLVTFPAVIVALPLLIVTAPAWVVVSLALDVVQGLRRLPTVRLGAFGVVYLVHEWLGLAVAGILRVGSTVGFPRGDRAHRLGPYRAMQAWWATSLMRWAGRLLGVRFDAPDPSTLPSSSFILVSRHASMVDAVLPAILIAGHLRRFIHYVLKDELRWDPNLDLYGHRLGNYFVTRGRNGEIEAERIARFADQAMPGSVLAIFPEGAYATTANRSRVLASLERRNPKLVGYARALRHLLPPKPAGTLALLDRAPEADVVVLGHVGLEGVAELSGLRRRLPLTDPIVVRWWHHPRDTVPTSEDERVAWLNDVWRTLDRWVDQVQRSSPSSRLPTGDPS